MYWSPFPYVAQVGLAISLEAKVEEELEGAGLLGVELIPSLVSWA